MPTTTRVQFKRVWSSGGGRIFRKGDVGEIFSNVAHELHRRQFVELLDDEVVAPAGAVETCMLDPATEQRIQRRGKPRGRRKGSKVIDGRVVMPSES